MCLYIGGGDEHLGGSVTLSASQNEERIHVGIRGITHQTSPETA